MKYIAELQEGSRVQDIYLVKSKTSAVTKNGKNYDNLTLQDKTGTIDAKVWDPNSPGISEFDAMDYVYIGGDVSSFAGSLQISVKQARRVQESEYIPSDYLPVSKNDPTKMEQELDAFIEKVSNPYLHQLLVNIFIEDKEFRKSFCCHSAAKTVHHSFIGGLLQHTLAITQLCYFLCKQYPLLNKDLLLTAALCHDIGKTEELSELPMNDYTEDGQLLGHIMIGAEMLHDRIAQIPDFPKLLENELKHCILAHHGELIYGSPKKPALAEAVALNMADNTDAKMETLTEIFENGAMKPDWMGYNRLFESNLRKTEV